MHYFPQNFYLFEKKKKYKKDLLIIIFKFLRYMKNPASLLLSKIWTLFFPEYGQ